MKCYVHKNKVYFLFTLFYWNLILINRCQWGTIPGHFSSDWTSHHEQYLQICFLPEWRNWQRKRQVSYDQEYCRNRYTVFSETRETIGHVRYMNILTGLRGFRVRIMNFLSFFCLSIPKRDSNTKKTTPNIEVWPESLGAMLEYWYIERGLLSPLGL